MRTSGISSKLGKVAVAEALFYVAFCLFVFKYLLDHTTFTDFFFVSVVALGKFIQTVTLMLLVGKFISQRASFFGWAAAGTLVLVGFVSWRISGESWLFWLAMFVVCSEEIRLRPLAAIVLAVFSIMFVVTVAFAGAGVIEDTVRYRPGFVRHSLGFSHPNTFALVMLVICVANSVLRFGKNPAPDILLILLADIVGLAVADSRTIVVMSLFQVLFLLLFYFVKTEAKKKIVLRVICIGIFTSAALSYYFMACFDSANALHMMLNSALSSRLYLAHTYYSMQGLTMFGSSYEGFAHIYWENGVSSAFVVDNAWCHLLLRFGVVPTFLFLFGLILLLRKIVKEVRWDALSFGLLLTLIYGVSEVFGIRFECNYFLYALGAEVLFQFANSKRRRSCKSLSS